MRTHRPFRRTGRPLHWVAGLFLLATATLFAVVQSGSVPATTDHAAFPETPSALTVDNLTIKSEYVAGRYRTCPLYTTNTRRAFCRNFDSPPLAACGHSDDFYLILSDGELHRVNDALIGKNGGFNASYESESTLHLETAWLPTRDCNPIDGPPEVLAMDQKGQIQHFDGDHWHSVGIVASSLAN
jgi:hypothetical protein